MRFHELLLAQREQLIHRWLARVEEEPHPAQASRAALTDHVPQFIDELAIALRLLESPNASPTAATHGTQRLQLGFDIATVVREYGALQDIALELAFESGTKVERPEARVLSESIITGIADAVAEYARQRDAELQREATQHFSFVAHELRNPLQAARMALTILKGDGQLRDGGPAAALERALERMHDLIDHSLELAQLGAGVEAQYESLAVGPLLEEIGKVALATARAKDVELEVHPEGDIRVEADHRLVRSAVSNLVNNAVKFTRPRTKVRLRARIAGSVLEIEVEDGCGGLPAGFVDKAFVPFVQQDRKREGFGLGLAIAKQAAEAHHGSIEVRNQPPKGCTFVFRIPEARPA